MSQETQVALIGCGLIGERRLETMRKTGRGRPRLLYDPVEQRARHCADHYGGTPVGDPERIWQDPKVEVVVVATPNCYLAEYGKSVLQAGKHLLVEKPGVCTVKEWATLRKGQGDRRVKIGFNHRYHPAARMLASSLEERREDEAILWVRGAYGHGGRPGYEEEWRFDATQSGGGEIIDQGVHLLDLAYWFTGEPLQIEHVVRQNAFYRAAVEDNGFLLLRTESGIQIQFHCSVTQWKNLFRFEIATTHRLFVWEGLGNKNYGDEKLTIFERPPGGAVLRPGHTFLTQPNAIAGVWSGNRSWIA